MDNKNPSSTSNIGTDASLVGGAMLIALILGCAVTWWGATSPASALLWAAACSSVGWVLGFLFGIPRSLSSDTARTGTSLELPEEKNDSQMPPAPVQIAQPPVEPAQVVQPSTQTNTVTTRDLPKPRTFGPSTAVNTNLEQISDWLTKIIVGVTLVEIRPALARLEQAAIIIAGAIGGEKQVSYSYAIIVYFSMSGFLSSYLLTRLFLQRAFNDANR